MLQLKNILRRVTGSDRPLLADISLNIDAGQRLGIIGPSGGGKSSLLRVMAMLDPIDAGEILFHGRRVADADVPGFRRRVIYLPQRPALIKTSVRNNLSAPFRFASGSTPYDEKRIVDLLQQLGKSVSILDQNADQLSGGEQLLIALVRAIQLEPIVLLLDEPTASLDEKSVLQVEQIVAQWHSQDESRSLVWVGHDREQVRRVTDHVIRMEGGRLA